MEAIVLVLNANKAPERRGKILFVDARGEFYRDGVQSFLNEDHQTKILKTYRNFASSHGFASVADLDEIRTKGHTLALSAYVAATRKSKAESGSLSVTDAVASWRLAATATEIAFQDAIEMVGVEAR